MQQNDKNYEVAVKVGMLLTVLIAAFITLLIFSLSSCRCITVQQAANGKAKCGKWLK